LFPDDGLCKPKHVGATLIILKVLIIISYNFCAIVGQIKYLILSMHGATMKITPYTLESGLDFLKEVGRTLMH